MSGYRNVARDEGMYKLSFIYGCWRASSFGYLLYNVYLSDKGGVSNSPWRPYNGSKGSEGLPPLAPIDHHPDLGPQAFAPLENGDPPRHAGKIILADAWCLSIGKADACPPLSCWLHAVMW